MDPAHTAQQAFRPGFPRTRGDGPLLFVVHVDVDVFPPHTRGWTLAQGIKSLFTKVSPAHAGMDHLAGKQAPDWCSFPRTRGDGPLFKKLPGPIQEFPPHTRGWTIAAGSHWRGTDVSPAHAGMDPRNLHRSVPRSRFPRTRGDGPGTVSPPDYFWLFPPHTRGWTLAGRDGEGEATVSPAHAGMDPK